MAKPIGLGSYRVVKVLAAIATERVAAALYCCADLRSKRYRSRPLPAGLCYVASEAIFHASLERLFVLVGKVEDETHWWLERANGSRIDPTARQFDEDRLAAFYANGRRAAFLTRKPSKRAVELLRRSDLILEGRP